MSRSKPWRPEHLSDATELAINLKLDKLREMGEESRAEVAGPDGARWKAFTDFFVGGENHWNGYTGTLPMQFTYNRTGRNILVKMGLLVDANMTGDCLPRGPEDEIGAIVLDLSKECVWERQGIPRKNERIMMSALVCGTGIGKVVWDKDAFRGEGEVDVLPIPITGFFMEPGALTVADARWVMYERMMDVAEVRSKFGLRPKEVSETELAEKDLFKIEDTGSSGGTSEFMMGPVDYGEEPDATVSDTLVPAADYVSGLAGSQKVLVQEFMIEDVSYSEEDEEYEDVSYDVETGEETVEKKTRKKKRPHFPGGRVITRVGREIVVDEPNPFEHGEWPYFFMIDQLDPHRAHGDTTIRSAMPIQKELNLVGTVLAWNIHMNTATTWILYRGSGVTAKDLKREGNKPGGVLFCNHPALKPERAAPPMLQGNLFDAFDALVEQIDKVMMINDTMPPNAKGWPSSGEVVNELRESALVEIRKTMHNMSAGIQREVMLICETMKQFYTTDRFVRVVGPLSPQLESAMTPGGDAVVAGEYDEMSWKEQIRFVTADPEMLKAHVDYRVTPATWEPLSKQKSVELLMQMHELDSEAVPLSIPMSIMDFPMKAQAMRSIDLQQAAPAEPELAPGQVAVGAPGTQPAVPLQVSAPPVVQGGMNQMMLANAGMAGAGGMV